MYFDIGSLILFASISTIAGCAAGSWLFCALHSGSKNAMAVPRTAVIVIMRALFITPPLRFILPKEIR
jgi:hypothetical protein